MERTLDFLGFPNYSVSRDGVVMNIKRQTVVNGTPDKDGYIRITLCSHERKKAIALHRIVALGFLENPFNLPEVDHINKNPKDNRVENLRWADRLLQRRNCSVRKSSKTGEKHIQFEDNGYRVKICRNYKRVFVKRYKTLPEAVQARDNYLRSVDEL